jgi:hypothetical protein
MQLNSTSCSLRANRLAEKVQSVQDSSFLSAAGIAKAIDAHLNSNIVGMDRSAYYLITNYCIKDPTTKKSRLGCLDGSRYKYCYFLQDGTKQIISAHDIKSKIKAAVCLTTAWAAVRDELSTAANTEGTQDIYAKQLTNLFSPSTSQFDIPLTYYIIQLTQNTVVSA